MEALAINVGANTSLPGFRAPIDRDGSFVYVPIPERKPTRIPVPTYEDLDLPLDLPSDLCTTAVHLDPTFASYPCCSDYTYGDEHGVKATPIGRLDAGDLLVFYATLETSVDDPPSWMPPRWGAYAIGHFTLAESPMVDAHANGLSAEERARYSNNGHVKRETLDARVLVRGDPSASRLYDVAIPLSAPTAGGDPGEVVTKQSTDSGQGPWWRRPLRFPDGTALLTMVSEWTP